MQSFRSRVSDTHYNAINYFLDLPRRPETSVSFFRYWDDLYDLAPGRVNARDCDLVLHRTALAYTAKRSPLQREDFILDLQRSMDAWEDLAMPLLPTADARFLASTINSYNAIGLMPGHRFMALWIDRASKIVGASDNIFLRRASMSLAGLAEIPPEKLLGPLLEEIKSRKTTFDQHDASNLYWSLAVWDAISGRSEPRFKDAAMRLNERIKNLKEAGKIDVNDQCGLQQINDACLWFKFKDHCPPPQRTGDTHSSLERDFRKIFDEAHIRVMGGNASLIKGLGRCTDMALQMMEGVIHFEADGFYHFVYLPHGRRRYNGHTLLNSLLICEVAPTRMTPNVTVVRCSERTLHKAERQVPHIGQQMFGVFRDVASAVRRHRARGPFVLGVENRSIFYETLHA